jgi:hypothetical protein
MFGPTSSQIVSPESGHARLSAVGSNPVIRTRLRVKPQPMPANVRQLIARHCKRNSLAGIGQRWLEGGAGDGNRTHGSSLGSLGITIIRRPRRADHNSLAAARQLPHTDRALQLGRGGDSPVASISTSRSSRQTSACRNTIEVEGRRRGASAWRIASRSAGRRT